MKIKTSELWGVALDWAVAESLGMALEWSHALGYFRDTADPDGFKYSPSTEWGQGGPLIDQFDVALNSGSNGDVRGIFATVRRVPKSDPFSCGFGPTRLIAAMRAIVAAEMGVGVDVPDSLMSEASG